MSMTPARHCVLVVPSARNANTAAGGRAICTVLLASGIDPPPRKQRIELVKPTLPAHLVGRRPVTGWEFGMGEHQLGLAAAVVELDAHQRLRAVGGGAGLPAPRVEQPSRRLDLAVGAADDERIALGRLHGQAVAAPGPEVQLRLRAGELARPPPAADLLRLGPRLEHLLARRVDDAGDSHRVGRWLGTHVASFADLKWSESESRRRSQNTR